jgi:adenylyltransferase/sulfurtransferase
VTDEIVKRYTRQMILPDIGQDGQQAIGDGHALIIGLGGLGSPAAIYLAAAGIGQLTIVDYDRVDLSNLHRQILYTEQDIGKKKTAAAKEKLQQLNPVLRINLVDHRMTDDELVEHCSRVDVVLDCSDNFATRHAVNKACVKNARPLVSGAAIRFEGQIGLFNLGKQSPCYACLYPEGDDEAQRCSEAGVLGPLVGVIGSMQAMETIKLLTASGENLDGRLLIFDARNMQWRSIKLQKDPLCPVCSRVN